MTAFRSSLYDAIVVHRRLRPVTHELRYKLTYALIDLDEIRELDDRLRFFSHNRPNLFSLYDRDHGPGDGTPLAEYARSVVAGAGMAGEIDRVRLLCLPRLMGYVFNPLSVYYGLARDGALRLVVYEVSNTFGERKTYVLPVEDSAVGPLRQNCAKRFYVSPFNDAVGRYDFRVIAPEDRVRVGVSLSNENGGILDAHLVGARRDLSDGALARTILRHHALTWPVLPFKVIGGIHWEALKLYLKGLRPMPRPPAPEVPVTYLPTALELDRPAR